jgi:hypothetical protein
MLRISTEDASSGQRSKDALIDERLHVHPTRPRGLELEIARRPRPNELRALVVSATNTTAQERTVGAHIGSAEHARLRVEEREQRRGKAGIPRSGLSCTYVRRRRGTRARALERRRYVRWAVSRSRCMRRRRLR